MSFPPPSTESVCVPILRSDDNCSSPKIGSPWSPNIDDGNYEDVVKSAGPDEPRYRIRAYAGPMSPQEVSTILLDIYVHCIQCSLGSFHWMKYLKNLFDLVGLAGNSLYHVGGF